MNNVINVGNKQFEMSKKFPSIGYIESEKKFMIDGRLVEESLFSSEEIQEMKKQAKRISIING